MKFDKTSRQSFPNDGNNCQDCLANNCVCIYCFMWGLRGILLGGDHRRKTARD